MYRTCSRIVDEEGTTRLSDMLVPAWVASTRHISVQFVCDAASYWQMATRTADQTDGDVVARSKQESKPGSSIGGFWVGLGGLSPPKF